MLRLWICTATPVTAPDRERGRPVQRLLSQPDQRVPLLRNTGTGRARAPEASLTTCASATTTGARECRARPASTGRLPPGSCAASRGSARAGASDAGQRGSYVAKTARGLSDTLRRALGADDVAAQPGLLQRLDPRIKVASTLALLLAAAFVRDLVVFVALYGVVLAVAAASRCRCADSWCGCGCSCRSSRASSCCPRRST